MRLQLPRTVSAAFASCRAFCASRSSSRACNGACANPFPSLLPNLVDVARQREKKTRSARKKLIKNASKGSKPKWKTNRTGLPRQSSRASEEFLQLKQTDNLRRAFLVLLPPRASWTWRGRLLGRPRASSSLWLRVAQRFALLLRKWVEISTAGCLSVNHQLAVLSCLAPSS